MKKSLVIGGTSSGVGKTIITLALLHLLKNKNLQSFKVGPDFIDPLYHKAITGMPSYNLDSFLLSENTILSSFYSKNFDIAIIEGVMGLFDGLGPDFYGSTAHIAKIIGSPIILVIDGEKLSYSAAAILHGFKNLDKSLNISGVIFNKIGGEGHLRMLKDSAKMAGVEFIGAIPKKDYFKISERHLGLVNPEEKTFNTTMLDEMSEFLDIDKLYELSAINHPTKINISKNTGKNFSKIKIGVALDKAFFFYYQDNLDFFKERNVNLVFFSPLKDELPDVDGLYIGGGYPELYADKLEKNEKIRSQIKKSRIPIYAECGGMLYLLRRLDSREMCSIFNAEANMTNKLQSIGYTVAETVEDTLIAPKNYLIKGHEFHYSQISINENFAYRLIRGKGIKDGKDGLFRDNVIANYMHLHALSDPFLFEHFLSRCHDGA
ncbi:MAG: hydrogenobyrinic acid a,c-diamide synthase (glutamine-hydrolyzing) [Candidatus Methanoliparum thermophilum]|uniref:Cobyrinate a,c-diamide synthase n=1 Tax=Methanoliparum thermophilum TaxID=2491083 RepID=A0A520KRP8_METT2|nr:MAG: hydrogenobyrinic acid a,c-diamide synthase (glutamine-hydrolyzing) [Candidatus Methanoliparum thermophilum]